MKHLRQQICILLVIVLSFVSTFAVAEPDDPGVDMHRSVFDGISDAFDRLESTLEEAADGVAGLFSQERGALGGAVGSAGEALADVWASTTDAVEGAWSWIGKVAAEKGEKISVLVQTTLSDLKTWLATSGDNALEVLRTAYEATAKGIGMAGNKVEELWNALQEYAAEHEIEMVVLVKLTLAIMVRISLGRQSKAIAMIADKYIGEEVRVIMGWFECFGIDSEAAAEQALTLLKDALHIS